MNYTLDTNIVTALMKNDKKVWTTLEEKTFRGEEVSMNAISYYEIKRGLLSAKAAKKLSIFERLCRKFGTLFFRFRFLENWRFKC